jgi:hypothetical protein
VNLALRRPPTAFHLYVRAPLRRAAPFLAVVVFVFLVLYRLTLMGEALYWGDIFLYFYPLEHVVQMALKEGRIPLWNPYVLCGQPLVGNPQSWVYYPTTALLTMMPVWFYFTLNTILHLTLAGLGTYLYLRRVCGDRLGALLGAITYCGSGFVIARLQFPPMVQSMAYLPWLLLLVDRLIDRPGIGYAALFALMVTLELLAAHTQIAYMTFACAMLYAAARLWHIRRHRERARRALGAMATAYAVGILAASVQLLPALQLFPFSTRGHLTWMQANRFVFLPEHLINLLDPYYYGFPARGDYWGAGNAWEPCVYLGILPLVLAAYAIIRAGRRAAVRFFAVLGAAALWLSMGRFGGIYWFAYYIVPGLASFHDPARFTFLAIFSLAVLAAVGMRALRDRRVADATRGALVALAAVNLWWFSAHFNPSLKPSVFRYRPRAMAAAPKAGEGRVFTALREQVWDRYLNETDYGPDSARYAHEVTDTLSPNIGMRFGVEEGSGYEPVPIRAITEVDGLVRTALARHSPSLPSLLGLFDTRVLLLPQSTRYRYPALRPVRARGVTALVVRDPMPRAWLVRRTVRVEGAARELAALASPDFDPRRAAIIASGEELDAEREGRGESDYPRVPVSPRPPVPTVPASAFDVNAGDAPAFLVWSAACYPGWTVRVDGRPSRAIRTDHAFLGVAVPEGKHRVEFEYNPFVVRFASYMSMVGFAILSCGLTLGRMIRPARQGKRAGERGNQARVENYRKPEIAG